MSVHLDVAGGSTGHFQTMPSFCLVLFNFIFLYDFWVRDDAAVMWNKIVKRHSVIVVGKKNKTEWAGGFTPKRNNKVNWQQLWCQWICNFSFVFLNLRRNSLGPTNDVLSRCVCRIFPVHGVERLTLFCCRSCCVCVCVCWLFASSRLMLFDQRHAYTGSYGVGRREAITVSLNERTKKTV